MSKVTGLPTANSSKINFSEWDLQAMDEFKNYMQRIISEAITIATSEYQCNAWFPIAYSSCDGVGGKIPTDPTSIYVELPLGNDEDDYPRWDFKLTDLVTQIVENHELGDGGKIDPEYKHKLVAVRDDLRRLANVLDEALNR